MDDQNQTGPTSAGLLRALRRRLWVIAISVVVVAAAAVAFSLLREDEYSATAVLLFRESTLDDRLFGTGEEDRGDPFRTAATNLQLVSLDVVAERTAEDVGGLTGDDIDSKVDVSERGQSDLVSVTATDPAAERAALIANSFATKFIEFRKRADLREVRDTERAVERRLAELEDTPITEPEERVLSSQLKDLAALSALETGNVELAERAEVPDDPSSPGAVWSGVVGAIVGLVLGVGLAYLFTRLDRRVRDPRDVQERFERPILGILPEGAFAKKDKSGDRLLTGAPDVFRSIGANLRYFAPGGDVKALAVASADRGDGRTTVAWNLAAAVATTGRSAVLVEADLRDPSLAVRLGLERGAGLSDVLAGQSHWEDAVVRIPIGEQSGGDASGHSFDLLPAGHRPPNPADLLGAESMTALLRLLKASYDLVVVDTSAAGVASEAVPLVANADGVVVVVRLGHSSREGMDRLHQLLTSVDARVLGVVINSASARKSSRDGERVEAPVPVEDKRTPGLARR